MPTVLLVLLVTLCTIGSQLILKSGVNSLVAVLRNDGIVPFLFAAMTSPKVITALAIQGGGYVIWLFVLAQSRLSVAFAISGSFFYLVMAAASWLVFGERLTPAQWVGLVLISLGVILVTNGNSPLSS
jgi:drug/metabolite transporter (DMT)-like permease